MDYCMEIRGELTVIRRTSSTVDVEWKLEGFTSFTGSSDLPFSSPSFCFVGNSWFLELNTFVIGSLLIRIQRESVRSPVNFDTSTSFKASTGDKILEEHHRCVFDGKENKPKNIVKIISISDIIVKRRDILPSGTLTILCTLRMDGSSENEKGVSDLQILKLSHYSAPVTGEREIILLCGKVNKNDIEILFYEEDEKGERIWSDTGKFSPQDVHLQGAISFKTPPYKTTKIQKEIVCLICLRRPSDGSVSEPKEFTLCPPKEDYPCTSTPSVEDHENKTLLDYKELFLSKEDSDAVMKVKGEEFPVHRLVLEARSPVLASAFRNDMKEKATGIVDVEDCDPSSFSEFLCFLYCGSADITVENVFSLFTTADKYDVKDLREKCLKIVKENLSVDTFCDTMKLALLHSENDLIKLATDFFIKYAPQIVVTVKWQSFLTKNPIRANELIIKSYSVRK